MSDELDQLRLENASLHDKVAELTAAAAQARTALETARSAITAVVVLLDAPTSAPPQEQDVYRTSPAEPQPDAAPTLSIGDVTVHYGGVRLALRTLEADSPYKLQMSVHEAREYGSAMLAAADIAERYLRGGA